MPQAICYWSTPNAGSNRVDVNLLSPYGLELALLAYSYRATFLGEFAQMPSFQLRDGIIYAYADPDLLAVPNFPNAAALDTAKSMCTTHHITADVISFIQRQDVSNPPYWLISAEFPTPIIATPAEIGAATLALCQMCWYWTYEMSPTAIEPEEVSFTPDLDPFGHLAANSSIALFGINDYYVSEEEALNKLGILAPSWNNALPGA